MANWRDTRMHFRKLSEDETFEFRLAARCNYTPFTTIDGTWHPVYQMECASMNSKAAIYEKDLLSDT